MPEEGVCPIHLTIHHTLGCPQHYVRAYQEVVIKWYQGKVGNTPEIARTNTIAPSGGAATFNKAFQIDHVRADVSLVLDVYSYGMAFASKLVDMLVLTPQMLKQVAAFKEYAMAHGEDCALL